MKGSIRIGTKERKTGQLDIKLDVAHRNQRKRVTIGSALLSDWDLTAQIPLPSHPDYQSLYGRILDMRAKAQTPRFLNETDVAIATGYLTGVSVRNDNVQDYAQREVRRLRSIGKQGNADHVYNCMRAWAVYAPDLTFQEIDRELIANFKRDKKGTITDTTIKSYVGILRKIFNIAIMDKSIQIDDKDVFRGCMSGLHIRTRRARNVYLNDKNLNKLITRKVKGDFVINASEHRALDLTLLQFYLGGANLKDVYYLEEAKVLKKRVLLSRSKLGDRAEYFDLKLFEPAREILKKHSKPTDGYVLPWRKDALGYKNFRDNHNKDLRSVQQKINLKISPINAQMSSNVIRHTFATRAKFLGINADIIRELMGHERTDIDTVYKDVYPEKVRDKAHKKIIKL